MFLGGGYEAEISIEGRILTIKNLHRKGMNIVVNHWCLCGSAEESTQHLFIHCEFSYCLVPLAEAVWAATGDPS
uniref:Reverse transcriptase zinc-binding domain-containing protein n=1 Tax=Nelumbo nucifera TaxID=4432 RepID=A0A822YYK0_NELNU|nr:TPA_asm: hypothetical protein HUJ06_007000 [Nelumbo nucifera]